MRDSNIYSRFTTTWKLIQATSESTLETILKRIMFLATPAIISIGLLLALINQGQPLLGVFISLFAFVVIFAVTTNTSDEAAQYANDHCDTPDTFRATEIHPEHPLSPKFFEGVGEWMVEGHVPPSEFLEAIIPLDPILRKIPLVTLQRATQYTYAISQFTPRFESETIKIVPGSTPDSFPITRLRAPYDYR